MNYIIIGLLTLNVLNSKIENFNTVSIMKYFHQKYGREEVAYTEVLDEVKYWSNYYGFDLDFALSFFAIESGFTYVCKSNCDARGLGQVTKIALDDYNKHNKSQISFESLYDYKTNIMVSLGYLSLCEKRYNGIIENKKDLVVSYNIGIGNLQKLKSDAYGYKSVSDSAKRYYVKFCEAYNMFKHTKRRNYGFILQ